MLEKEYEIFFDYVSSLLQRRQAVTTIHLSVNAAILAAVAIIQRELGSPAWMSQLALLPVVIIGITACALWRRLILQYRILLGWWYEQLRRLETEIPNSSGTISREYEELYRSDRSGTRMGMSRYEVGITWIMTGVYLLIAVVLIVNIARWV